MTIGTEPSGAGQQWALSRRGERRDPYADLDLDRRASHELIAESYWLLVRLAREQLPPEAAANRISQLGEAYQALSTAEFRQAYAARALGEHSADVDPSKGSRPAVRPQRGAPAVDDYYELLCIDMHARPAVVELALQVVARELRASRDRQHLLGALEDARMTLLEPELRAAYDARLRGAVPARLFAKCHQSAPARTPRLMRPPGQDPVVAASLEISRSPMAPGSANGSVRGAPAHSSQSAVSFPPVPATSVASPGPTPAPRSVERAHEGVAPPPDSAVAPAPPAPVEPADAPAFAAVVQRAPQVRLATLDPELSARRVLTTPQRVTGIAVIAAIVAGLIVATQATLIVLISVSAALYVSSMAYKAYLAFSSLGKRLEIDVGVDDIAGIPDETLPIYTLILPLFHEAEVLGGLVRSIEALDYPKDKLDVKLLLEEDDRETQSAAAAMQLPPCFETLVVPPAGPQGKPRACNWGLAHARGAYLVLYDAEDRPEPDQLKKALIAFATGGRDVACVQAKLSFYNPDQNFLTKWFTIEYSTWFDLYLPALSRLGAPIPLGGTSNHFRVEQLRALGGWDAYNVTEDADLGVRLARQHLRTALIDSVTYEEANSRLGNWLRQRSRWVKGYMQTWLVHMRHPLRLYEEVGASGFAAFQVMVLGTFAAYLVNPVFWGLLIAWYATHAASIEAVYPAPLLYVSAIAFFAGNFLFIVTAVAGSLQKGFYHGVKYALVNHLYWALMSVASWKALYQLAVRPHYWEKTRHGLDAVPAGEAGRPS